jgi:hypothetical protein
MSNLSPVPGHIRTALPHSEQGYFCKREGEMAPGGQCPDGCDHAEHYANDGHPECEEKLSLYELERRARNSSATDPSWRQDYSHG